MAISLNGENGTIQMVVLHLVVHFLLLAQMQISQSLLAHPTNVTALEMVKVDAQPGMEEQCTLIIHNLIPSITFRKTKWKIVQYQVGVELAGISGSKI
ncbi:uncharacterized protein MONOS_7600 [Monocercomonoides exilis]|uniref:uncharacterized protein n=1 Tax=Monocercomonoides exilis TaxID=2049356 RepID=UPI00355AC07A|nr:hypothetical protein MONOS_7600 [Monocercomonoides exilis]|eukprot:MONOS_7600.1-p1 / transcript=MONOS_7600.1 / gene=MONOS_7600 / organism=Monocercomonoides_exilis_PA203 / gene_product=unspecified product / transcript_product=unspecified product / location=Mono_scaffold00264:4489-4839(-) / protein_length=98 / sequence_SO=supercontig / SO=protein_coding / is_pseudo=false